MCMAWVSCDCFYNLSYAVYYEIIKLESRKRPQTVGDFIRGLGDLLAIPKTFQADFKDIPNRFQGCSGQISGMFWADFRDIPSIYLQF
jgi:hypothetical protein